MTTTTASSSAGSLRTYLITRLLLVIPMVWILVTIVFFVMLIAEVGIVFYASFALPRLTPAAAASLFLVYSLLTGLTLSVLLFMYTAASLVQAFVVTAGMFGAVSVLIVFPSSLKTPSMSSRARPLRFSGAGSKAASSTSTTSPISSTSRLTAPSSPSTRR